MKGGTRVSSLGQGGWSGPLHPAVVWSQGWASGGRPGHPTHSWAASALGSFCSQMYTCTRLDTLARTHMHTCRYTWLLDPEAAGLQGSPGQMLTPTCAWLPLPTPAHTPSLHREEGFSSQQGLRYVGGQQIEATGSLGFLFSL